MVMKRELKIGNAMAAAVYSAYIFIFSTSNLPADPLLRAVDLGTVAAAGNLSANWVGFGDVYDYRKFTLNSGAKLQFTVNSTDAVKFTVYNEAGKAVGNVAVKAGIAANTKDIMVSAGTYYLSVQSTTAKKGGNADYSVALNESSYFFPQGDNTNDTWQAAQGQTAKLAGEEITGWVGFGDAADFIKFQVAGDGQIVLD
ncbi:MAG: hypothetical protein J5858_07235, partial [Lentisphaeria bacterium]|nr:hypothetical protein [Lentisphaeria bacterium]